AGAGDVDDGGVTVAPRHVARHAARPLPATLSDANRCAPPPTSSDRATVCSDGDVRRRIFGSPGVIRLVRPLRSLAVTGARSAARQTRGSDWQRTVMATPAPCLRGYSDAPSEVARAGGGDRALPDRFESVGDRGP